MPTTTPSNSVPSVQRRQKSVAVDNKKRPQHFAAGVLVILFCTVTVSMAALTGVDNLLARMSTFGTGRLFLGWIGVTIGQVFVSGLTIWKLWPIRRARLRMLGRRWLAFCMTLASVACCMTFLVVFAAVVFKFEFATGTAWQWTARIALATCLPCSVAALIAYLAVLRMRKDMYYLQLCALALCLIVLQAVAYVYLLTDVL